MPMVMDLGFHVASSLMSSRSVLPRLGRLLLHGYKPAQLLPLTPRYTHHLHTVPRGSRSEVLDSIRGLFSRHVNRATAYRTLPLSPLPAAFSRSRPAIPPRRWYHDPRKVATTVLLPCVAAFTTLGALSHHEIVPYTNRAHRVILSPSSERELGDLVFDNIKKELGDKILGPSDPRTVRVSLIAADITRGVHRAFPTRSDGDSGVSSYNDTSSITDGVNERQEQRKIAVEPQTGHLRDLNCEVIVVKDDRVNACSFPGGRIIVTTGLLDYLKTDAEIAAILTHEVGHAVARHYTEFTKITMLIPILPHILPFSRRKEMEADLIRVMLLAAAGFDPRVAAGVYEKLGEIDGDSAWCDYIGSHPSCKKRSRLLSRGKTIDKALELYYKQISAGEGADRHFPYGGRS